MLEKITSSYKAVTVFVAAFAVILVPTLADPAFAAALPEGWLKWLTVVGVPAVLGAAAWLKRNQYTVEEAAELLKRAQDRAQTSKS